jgi:hypothetical protein
VIFLSKALFTPIILKADMTANYSAYSDDFRDFPDTKEHRSQHPELYTFVYKDAQCSMKRNSFKVWCGYAKYSSKMHRSLVLCRILHRDYPNVLDKVLSVHGGITYLDGQTVGFDCGHYDDYIPELNTGLGGQTYRNRDFVILQLMTLVDELEQLT